MGTATVIIANHTPVSLRLTDSHRDWGDWGVSPPEFIEPGGRKNFRGETDGAGSSGYVAYQSGISVDPAAQVVREERRLEIRWSRPYIGDNTISAKFPEWHGGGAADSPLTVDIRQTMTGSDPTWVVNILLNPDYSSASVGSGEYYPSFHGPSCVSWDPTRLDLFAAALDASLMHRWFTDKSGWSSWECIVQPSPRAVHRGRASRWWATSWGPGRLDAFGLARDGHLEHVWYQEGLGWGQWDDLGGDGLTGCLAAASSAPGRIHVVGVDGSGAVRHLSHSKGAWGTWTSVGGLLAANANPLMLAAASPGPGRVDLFSVDASGAVNRARWTDASGAWTAWENLGISSPVPLELNSGSLTATFVGGQMRLFGMAIGGHLLQAKESVFTKAGRPLAWLDWTNLASVDQGASACTRGNTVHVMASKDDQTVNTYIELHEPRLEGEESVGTETLTT